MTRTHKLIITAFVPIMAILLALIVRFDNEVHHQHLGAIHEQLVTALKSQLGREEENALRSALVLATNPALVDALKADDEDRGYRLLASIMDEVNRYTNTMVRAQIITADYTLFARNWDNTYSGMPLEDSRSDLDYFKRHKMPRVSIEVGRRLGIKATVPMYESNALIGFVEVLQFFDDTTAFFRELGIDFYTLLDDRYYNTAVLMQFNPTVENYIVANRAYNATHLKLLERIDMKHLQHEQHLLEGNQYVFYEPMHNAEGESLGGFVMLLPEAQISHFTQNKEALSFVTAFTRQNLYDIVQKETLEDELYRSRYDKALLYLKDTVSEEDRELFLQEAQEILESYSKEELIAMILEHRSARRIEGAIR